MVDSRTGVASAGAATATAATTSSSSSSGHGSSSSSSSSAGDSSSSGDSAMSGSTTHGGKTGSSGGGGGESKAHGSNPLPGTTWMWTAFCGVLALLALRRAYALYSQRRHEKRTAEASFRTAGKGNGALVAAGTSTRNVLFATGVFSSLPEWIAGPETVVDAIWTFLYFSVSVVIVLYTAPWLNGTQQQISNVFGIVAYAQAPFMMFTVMKNNPISLIIGRPYQGLNYLHRASSRLMFVFSWLHTGLSFKNLDSRNQWRENFIVWGWVAMGAYTFIWFFSFTWVRRRLHQFFFISHVVLAFFYLIGCYYHWDALGFWLYASFTIWAFDRVLRLVRVAWANKLWKSGRGQMQVQLLADDCLCLKFSRPGFKWSPGQHVFLSTPWLSKGNVLEAHPFTAANAVNDEGDFIILARVYDGFTRQLRDKVSSTTSANISCYLDGPYGESHSLRGYDSILIVAGGTGIAPWMSHLLSLVGPSKTPLRCQTIHIVWSIQQATSISWIAPLLDQAAEQIRKRNFEVQVLVDVHVTRGAIPVASSSSFSTAEKLTPTSSGSSTPQLSEISASEVLPTLEHKPSSFSSLTDEKTALSTGLKPAAAKLVRWRTGRPDLVKLIKEDAQDCPERMALGVCGPRGLSNTVRTALKTVNNYKSVRSGQIPIDYFEESLGA
ncbi:hypothetical protein JCM8097_007102 [Rhodosporidiobolus ruineniae]